MKAVVQRVAHAQVEVQGTVVGAIGHGLLVLLCVEHGDGVAQADRLLAKLLKLRIFADAAGKMNRSLQETRGELLIVSQFTLAAEIWHGNRPSFTGAALPAEGRKIYDDFVAAARQAHEGVQSGIFGADMQLSLLNDGPVTLMLQV
jgi:D-tyrosyl-tRNA(Tyr) deacylase